MINILFILCVSYAGADNCDYSWFIVDDLDVAGSYDPATKTVLVTPIRTVETIIHEVGHIQCELKYIGIEIFYCNYTLDLSYMAQSIQVPQQPEVIPRVMSGKMINSLGLVGVVQDYNGRLR